MNNWPPPEGHNLLLVLNDCYGFWSQSTRDLHFSFVHGLMIFSIQHYNDCLNKHSFGNIFQKGLAVGMDKFVRAVNTEFENVII